MRIITGTLKGRKISVPPQVDMRPTSDRAKESIFAIIEVRKDLSGCTVLDLFAGSGNLGFEAVSRGAASVVFVEQSEVAADHIGNTARQFGVENQIRTVSAPVEAWLRGAPRPFDLVFADPPYNHEDLPDLPDIILHGGWLKPDGWFILEHDKRHHFGEHPNCVFSKPYGRTIVSIFRKSPEPDVP
ncbi:MAG: 16S rRNA (guanine(966)-N(2))-methyltransferase RsmD [Cyclonatronaceae bacterium]